MALFMSISEGIPEIKLAKVKMKMEFQSESDTPSSRRRLKAIGQ